MNALPKLSRQRGIGAIMAIVVLVILASLAAAMTRFGSIQHMTAAQDVLAVRALAAARAGLEYGLYQALRDTTNTACDTTPIWQLDLIADTGFHVSIKCQRSPSTTPYEYHEGEKSLGDPKKITIYTITATACNMPTGNSCENVTTVSSPGYIERQLQTVATNKNPDE